MTVQRADDASSCSVKPDEAPHAGNCRGPVAGTHTADGDAPQGGREPWIDAIACARDEVGGVDLELPAREPARGFSFEG